MSLCAHHACRCARAEEFARISDRTGDPRYLVEALEVYDQLVQCRQPATDQPKETVDER